MQAIAKRLRAEQIPTATRNSDFRHQTSGFRVGFDALLKPEVQSLKPRLRRWYKHLGKELYPNAKDIFITADGGGSNGSRNRLWKYCLQKFADESGLTIFMSHFPPGTSKWNKIEHRLFNHLSMNWKGQPLVSLRVMIELIGHTTSRTGLKVYAMEDDNKYVTKRKVDKLQFAALNLVRKDVLGKWNYKIAPRIS